MHLEEVFSSDFAIRYRSVMVAPEIPQRRGNYLTAFLHFDRQIPDDMTQALVDVAEALKAVEDATDPKDEAYLLGKLALDVSGLRERLDATTVDIAFRLKAHGLTIAQIARNLSTVRPTIDTWIKKLRG